MREEKAKIRRNERKERRAEKNTWLNELDIYNLDIADKNFIPAIAGKNLMLYLY